MNMKKRIAVILMALGSLTVANTQAVAANLLVRPIIPIVPITRSVYVYSFAETPPQSVDVSKAWMAQFLSNEPSDNLRPSADKTVRYVSEKDVNTTFEHN
jgi:HAMP domain-containing protein